MINYNDFLSIAKKKPLLESWHNKDTLDYWRHERMINKVRPIINYNNKATWLTIGDGRYGSDGSILKNLGAKNISCSDISIKLLALAKKKKLIKKYYKQNAENLTFKSSTYDYVLCKESFHHFSKPYLALYEMFRVSKKGVILIEPSDEIIEKGFFSFIYKFIRFLMNQTNSGDGFEEVGNYVYKISKREMAKFLLGMNYRYLAIYGLNDAYSEGIEFVNVKCNKLESIKKKILIKGKIIIKNLLCSIGIMKPALMMCILFKDIPSPKLLALLRYRGWQINEFKKNPFFNKVT
jgi:ubiquinone/menaquinone biosynthesis C-methylase UbiE